MGHGRYKLWAAVASVLFHVVALAVLAVAPARRGPESAQPIQTTSEHSCLAAVRSITKNSPIVPKPDIKRPAGAHFISRLSDLPVKGDIPTSNFQPENDSTRFPKSSSFTELAWSQKDPAPKEIEFFSSRTACKRICYLVDCSGSMKGLLQQVRDELARSIQTLQSDQYFGILFFGDDKVTKFASGKLLRASNQAKENALAFIRSVDAAGRTNALAGFTQAVKMQDDDGAGPEVIMFLTDGFELSQSDAYKFRQDIIELRARYLADCAINTIGFWPSHGDRRLLESIAKVSQGRFVCVSGENL